MSITNVDLFLPMAITNVDYQCRLPVSITNVDYQCRFFLFFREFFVKTKEITPFRLFVLRLNGLFGVPFKRVAGVKENKEITIDY